MKGRSRPSYAWPTARQERTQGLNVDKPRPEEGVKG
uniref:Uncharacterized protein n=1 Tax=Klebsiella pneumoniae CG43 TaxID=1244085 RepID=Q6U5V0_KLEPN|nr:hypothetical protein LV214 [Klebsiella pneumoniae CG43]